MVEHHHAIRNVLVGLAAAAIAAGGSLYYARSRSASGPAYRYELGEVTRGAIEAKVTATGTVNPIVTVQVGTQVSGTIQALGADFNSTVQPHQMIAQIDPRLFMAAVAPAQANVIAARANVKKAQATAIDLRRIADRSRGLVEQNLIARQEADTAGANANAAEAAVEAARGAAQQAEAALATAKINLELTTIVSPIHGTVITRNVDIGQTVAASFASPTLFLIGENLAKMQVDTSIAEADVGRLAPGMTATFSVDAFPTERFHGEIREVRNSPQVVQNVVTYDAVIDVANPDLKLKPGMTANLEVIYADRHDVVRVPNAAIRFRLPQETAGATPATAPHGKKLVWVLRDGKPAAVVIDPGVSDGTTTELRGGDLRVGDRLIVEAIATKASSGPRIL
jgi:HlyD family secretion protein